MRTWACCPYVARLLTTYKLLICNRRYPLRSSRVLRRECPGLFVWNVHPVAGPPPAHAPVSPAPDVQLVLRTPELDDEPVPDIDLTARQWRLDFVEPAGNPVPQIFVVDAAGVRHIDGDVAVVADPSFPERRVLSTRLPFVNTTRIRGGRVAATPLGGGRCAVYTVRRCRPTRASGPPAAIAKDADLVDRDVRFLWNPFAVAAALLVPGPSAAPDPTDVLLSIGFAERDGEDAWHLQSLRRPPNMAWLHEVIPDAGFPIDPLSGVAATTRGDQSADVFAIVDPAVPRGNDGQLAVARWDPTKHSWSTLTHVTAASARRSNRPAAVSRSAGVGDVFWIDRDGRVATSASAAATPTVWSAPVQIGSAAVEVHPFAPAGPSHRTPCHLRGAGPKASRLAPSRLLGACRRGDPVRGQKGHRGRGPATWSARRSRSRSSCISMARRLSCIALA
jgi:hypothetical protein